MVRHGRARNNSMHIHVGRMPGIGLVEEGLTDVRNTADFLSKLPIRMIITSPLERTYCTAAILDSTLGTGITTDDRLVERSMGEQEGMSFGDAMEKLGDTSLAFWSNDTKIAGIGMEVLGDVMTRVKSIITEYSSGFDVVMVTHAEIIKAAMQSYDPAPPEKIRRIPCDNGSVTRFTDKGFETILSYQNLEYQPDKGKYG